MSQTPPYEKKNQQSIKNLFASIAPNYEMGNAILSLNQHKKWNQSLIEYAKSHLSSTQTYLDLCAGTGDIALTLLRQGTRPQHTYLIDFCDEMLQIAKKKGRLLPYQEITYLHENALHTTLEESSCDLITIAYGVRNVSSLEELFLEVHRLLKPGGKLAILELTRPNSYLLQMGHKVYLNTLVPLMGRWITSNQKAYQYLSQSINTFVSPGEMAYYLNKIKFKDITLQEKTFGIVTLLTCEK